MPYGYALASKPSQDALSENPVHGTPRFGSPREL